MVTDVESRNIVECDVAIVGCGPTGAALANLLGQQGLAVQILERNVGILPIPRAVHIDGETMRVFQSMGLAQSMLAIMRPGGGMYWVDASGATLLVRTGLVGLGTQGWHNDYYYHQPHLEAVLRQGLARFSHVQLREGVELKELHQDEGGITLRAVAVNAESITTIRSRYVIGCDGARSAVRRWVGDEFEDFGEHQGWLVVDGVLHHPLDLPEHTVQHCDPARPATSIYVQPLRRRWELMLLPSDDLRTITQPETVWQLLRPWVKPGQATLERAATYVFHSLVARRWQQGRVLLAGDAVHQTPPFLGQGLCAGIRDAANLAWKLGHACRQPQAGEKLLATYGPERIAHAREFVELAVEVGKIIQVTDPQEAAARDQRLQAQGLKFAFPTPQLGPGVHRASALPGRHQDQHGKVFLQGTLPDGQWFDDLVGQRFAVVLQAGNAALLNASLRSQLQVLDVVLIEQAGDKIQRWLSEQQVAVVIVRPDRYLFAACASLEELASALSELREWLDE